MENFLPSLGSNKHHALLKESVRSCILEELIQVQKETDGQDTMYKHVAAEVHTCKIICLLSISHQSFFVHLQSNVVVKNAAKIIELLRSGDIVKVDELLASSKSTISQLLSVVQQNQALRNGRLRMAIEKTVEAEMLVLFFRSGRLAVFDEVQPCSDEEYVMASLSMARELSRYCKERACEVMKSTLDHLNAADS